MEGYAGGCAVSTGGSALETTFREACGGGIAGAEMGAEQLDLLRDKETGKLPANVFQLIRDQGRAGGGPGRKPGSRNKRNQKLAQLICQEHGDPVLYMASIYSMPLDQLVEMLRLADDSAALEERLYALAEKIEADVFALLAKASLTLKQVDQLGGLVDRLGDIAKVLRNKPGDLAVKALALQKQAAAEVATYVHGKQPVSLHVEGRIDAVILAPSLAGTTFADPRIVEGEIRRRGLEGVDLEKLELLPDVDGDEDEEGGE